jgi:hypothetical protein
MVTPKNAKNTKSLFQKKREKKGKKKKAISDNIMKRIFLFFEIAIFREKVLASCQKYSKTL